MPSPNLIIFMADEHAREGLGCYGNDQIQTPAIDKLAGNGIRFANAYTPSPVCVPARAAFATGRQVNEIGCWSNAQPYHGQHASWGHNLREAGHEVVSIGKLHYRSEADDNGFSREIMPLHCRNGVGFVDGLLRRQYHVFETAHFVDEIGPGEDPYNDYDRRVAVETIKWLETEGRAKRDKPWVLFVSFVRPHYPLTCPKEFFDHYPLDRIEAPRFAGREVEFRHPILAAFRDFYDYDTYFDDHTRKVARASYFGLCSFVDDLVGQIMTTLAGIDQDQDTAIIYTSDHGELNGHHGLWTKMTMHEESVGIPLILSGAGSTRTVVRTPVSLVDIFPTVLDLAQLSPAHGTSLYALAKVEEPDRPVFSEYHDGGALTGFFMIRLGNWKYIHYPGYSPQLYNIADDPGEIHDLGLSAAHQEIRQKCLQAMVENFGDPDQLNETAFRDQAARIEELGGVEAILAMESFDFTPVE